MQHYRPLLCLICLVPIVFGCSKAKRPEGLPKLYPCTVTITQEGSPLAEAAVRLVGGVSDQWPITGLTNASGKATMITYGQFPGAPLGEYKITVRKNVEEVLTAGGENRGSSTNLYSLVDIPYTKNEATPLEIRIDAGRNRQTFDIGKKVHILVDSIRPGT